MPTTDTDNESDTPPVSRRRRRRWRLAVAVAVLAAATVVAGPVLWTRAASHNHLHSVADAPHAPVVIVFGAQLVDGRPRPFLAGRLTITAELVRRGHATAVLVSGDADGSSGNETAAMTRYLTERGVAARRIVADPYGRDTYDTCVRAARVYQIDRALLVTQSFHLPRAVALCRQAGIDADGVAARCDDCRRVTLLRNRVRETFACGKAVIDTARGRPPAVDSPPDRAIADALRP